MTGTSLSFLHGPDMANRFMLAPMTNKQSAHDGTASDAEIEWLASRARGGFSHIVTCASGVEDRGRGFDGELGVHAHSHIKGLTRLTRAVHAEGATVSAQLNHAGMRAIGSARVSASDNAETGARALSSDEIPVVIEAFAQAAARCEAAGFDGVQIHGAHGYLIGQFLSAELNTRTDDWGGTAAKRSRFLFEVVSAVRAATGADFQLSVRVSPERYGQDFFEITEVVEQLLGERQVDAVDMSLWDAGKLPDDPHAPRIAIMRHFLDLERGDVRMGVAGRIRSGAAVRACMDAGSDYVSIGKAAILHPSFPRMVDEDRNLEPNWLPVTGDYLRERAVSDRFIEYLSTWRGFVSDEAPPPGSAPFRSAWSDEVLGLAPTDAAR